MLLATLATLATYPLESTLYRASALTLVQDPPAARRGEQPERGNPALRA